VEIGRLGALVRYLRHTRPKAIFAAKTYANLTAIWARNISGTPCRLVISERTALSQEIATEATAAWRHVLPLLAHSYRQADVISAVSRGVADDLERLAHLPAGCVVALPNPLIIPDTMAMAQAAPSHPWFDGSVPVILAAGRLVPQKDFATLLRAFALLHHQGLPHRLVIAGEGKERTALLGMIESLGLAGWVSLPGFVDNPLALMSRAALFVLSSRFEGLPGVLIQALSCGCPVVATDCPSGPREILLDGRLGALVPVGDHEALARAMAATLAQPPERTMLKDRAQDFSRDAVARHTAELLDGRSPEVVVSQAPSKAAS
jgi:glycosyltransferase involved in cell wall biosynthesis